MAFGNTLQLTTVCAVSASPALTTVFRLSSNNFVWQSTLPLEAPTFLWQVSASYTGGWQNFTTWTSQTTSFLLTAAVYDSLHNFRLLENRRNSTVSLTSVSSSFSRSLTLTNLPSSENIELWLDATKGLFNGLSSLNVDTYSNAPNVNNASHNLAFGQSGGSSTGNFLGDLCEIIIYRGILTPSERSTVENYLKTKWGTP